MKKKVLMTATVPSMIGQFNMENIKLLLSMGYEVHVACNFKDRSVWTEDRVRQLEEQLVELQVKKIQIEYARTPYDIGKLLKAYSELKSLIQKEKYVLLHCHTPVAGLISRLAVKNAGTITKIIYTAHGFHFYKGAPLLNWILYYPIEKWMSRYTDVLITINKEDYWRAKKKLRAKEVRYIPGVGIDTEKIQNVQVDKKAKRREIGVGEDDIVLISVGELSKRKNHKIVIEAVAKMKELNVKYVVCGKGKYNNMLKEMADKLGISRQVLLLGFRVDVVEICKSSDVFVFPSTQEGLPVSLMEAMACGLPCVVSNIRGNVDLIEDGENGLLFQPTDVETLKKKLLELIYDKQTQELMGKKNREKVCHYTSEKINKIMCKIYGEKI